MDENLSTGYKVAISAWVMACIMAIGLSLISLGHNTFNKVTTEAVSPIENMTDMDAYGLASYGKPVPIAEIWKLVTRINRYSDPANVNGNITSFALKQRNATDPNTWDLLSDSVTSLDEYMDRKAYVSWSVNEKSGLYTMEVFLD